MSKVSNEVDEFSASANRSRPGFVRELAFFLMHNKKWWLTPIIMVLVLVGGLLVLGSTAAAPIIYTLF